MRWPALTRREVLVTGPPLIDEGLEAVQCAASARSSIATRWCVPAPRTKDGLLDGIVELVLGELKIPPDRVGFQNAAHVADQR